MLHLTYDSFMRKVEFLLDFEGYRVKGDILGRLNHLTKDPEV